MPRFSSSVTKVSSDDHSVVVRVEVKELGKVVARQEIALEKGAPGDDVWRRVRDLRDSLIRRWLESYDENAIVSVLNHRLRGLDAMKDFDDTPPSGPPSIADPAEVR